MTDPTNPDGTAIDESEVNPAVDTDATDVSESQSGSPDPATATSDLDTAQDPANVPVNDEPDENTVTPPADPDVIPAASETPGPTGGSAWEVGGLIPRDGSFGSADEVQQAQAQGLPSPAGTPLDTYSQEIIRGIEGALVDVENALAKARAQIAKVPTRL